MDAPSPDMKASDTLAYVRDAVVSVATYKRTFLEQSAAIGGAPVTKDELAEVVALDAAADIIQFALSAGQNAVGKGLDAPSWVLAMALKARGTLVAP